MQITSQSLSRLLPPSHSLESSSAKVICAGPGWQISARRAVKFFNLDCPSVFQTPINYKLFLQEITPLLVWKYFTLHSAPIPYHSQPFTLTDNQPISTAFYMVTDLTPRSTSFQPPTHKDLVRIQFYAAHSTCVIRSMRLLVRWISRLFLTGDGI